MNASNFKYGLVSELKPGFARVKFDEDEGIVSDWLPVLVRRSKTEKESWQLSINEHVVCLMDGYCEAGVILGAIPNDEDSPDPGEAAGKCRILFSDGTLFEYDVNSHKMKIDVKGSLEAKTTGAASIDAGTSLTANAAVKATVTAPDIELTGAVKIMGAVTVLGALSAGAISTVPGAGGGNGNISIEGKISVTGDVEATGDVKASGKSLKTHVHPGVTPGGGTTGLPQ